MTAIAVSFSTRGLWNSTRSAAVGSKLDQVKRIRFSSGSDSGKAKSASSRHTNFPKKPISMATLRLRKPPRREPRIDASVQELSIRAVAITMLGVWSMRSMYQAKGPGRKGIIPRKPIQKSIQTERSNQATAAPVPVEMANAIRIKITPGRRPKASLMAPNAGPAKNWIMGNANPRMTCICVTSTTARLHGIVSIAVEQSVGWPSA
mmetsp:Transcript_85297/g.118479  ORF Transcript_85297/g.118479 Transcript_85297/m.118479 type:complete len:206 (-) Transcript_85297:419-1036(-)